MIGDLGERGPHDGRRLRVRARADPRRRAASRRRSRGRCSPSSARSSRRRARPAGDGVSDRRHGAGRPAEHRLPDVTWSQFVALLGTAATIFFVILAQSAATSRAYAARFGDRFDENTDLLGLAAANASAGLSGTFVVNGSPTKTAMVDNAGGRSQLAQLFAALVVAIVLVFLTGPLSHLPERRARLGRLPDRGAADRRVRHPRHLAQAPDRVLGRDRHRGDGRVRRGPAGHRPGDGALGRSSTCATATGRRTCCSPPTHRGRLRPQPVDERRAGGSRA